MTQRRSTRVDVNGWIVLDKPVGVTSTNAVARLKRIFNAKKAGHAGTLDPLASGLLPIAFGEATKTVPFVQDGEKAYRFTVRWGIETDSDDADGKVTQTTELRPNEMELRAAIPLFVGEIMQTPPIYSAIKINGERAYDLAREGVVIEMQPRPVTIKALDLVSFSEDQAVLEARCSKGTYVRAIARDLGRHLGCLGHVTALRRTRVGPFTEFDAVQLETLETEGVDVSPYMQSVETGLAEVPCVIVDRDAAARLRRGQPLILRGRDAPAGGIAYAACGGVLVAFGPVEGGELTPHRVFNLPY
jgi:tRNA pseudouridine55 synthase